VIVQPKHASLQPALFVEDRQHDVDAGTDERYGRDSGAAAAVEAGVIVSTLDSIDLPHESVLCGI
jgi:hypothetical protein